MPATRRYVRKRVVRKPKGSFSDYMDREISRASKGIPYGTQKTRYVSKPRVVRTKYTYDRPGPWGKTGRAVGSAIGSRFGSAGAAVGSKLGGYLHYIGRIFGSGDYVTSAGVQGNNLMGAGAQAPQFAGPAQQVRVRHREYLGDVISSHTAGAFQIQSFPINPGLSATLPWLSQVCGSTFQQYRINGMVFEFRSMSADALNSTNTALGQVIMATDYDSKDSPFTSKQQMENTMFGVSCKPSCSMIHAIECARNQTAVSELYIRAQAVPTGADVRLYDMGNFYIATNGCQGIDVNLGELWVSYDITLFKPIEQPPGFLIPAAHYQLDPAQVGTKPVAVLSTNTGVDNIGLTFNANGLAFSFPTSIVSGSVWLITVQYTGTGTVSPSAPAVTLSGGLIATPAIFKGNTTSNMIQAPSPSGTQTQTCISFLTKYNGSGTVASPPTYTATVWPTPLSAYSSADLFITQVNAEVL